MGSNLFLDRVSKIAASLSGVFGFLTFMAIVISNRGGKIELSEVLSMLNSPDRGHQIAAINAVMMDIVGDLPLKPESVIPKLSEGMSLTIRYFDEGVGHQLVLTADSAGEITTAISNPIDSVVAFTEVKTPFGINDNSVSEVQQPAGSNLIEMLTFVMTDNGCLEVFNIDLGDNTSIYADTCSREEQIQEAGRGRECQPPEKLK